jgi:hypothetical protein
MRILAASLLSASTALADPATAIRFGRLVDVQALVGGVRWVIKGGRVVVDKTGGRAPAP